MVSEAGGEGGDTTTGGTSQPGGGGGGGRRGSWPPSRTSLLEGTYNVEYLGMFKHCVIILRVNDGMFKHYVIILSL
jgi:hypothetical protein